MTMAASKLPTILGGGDGDLKSQNASLKQQVDDLKAKVVHLEGQLISNLKSKPKGMGEEGEHKLQEMEMKLSESLETQLQLES